MSKGIAITATFHTDEVQLSVDPDGAVLVLVFDGDRGEALCVRVKLEDLVRAVDLVKVARQAYPLDDTQRAYEEVVKSAVHVEIER